MELPADIVGHQTFLTHATTVIVVTLLWSTSGVPPEWQPDACICKSIAASASATLPVLKLHPGYEQLIINIVPDVEMKHNKETFIPVKFMVNPMYGEQWQSCCSSVSCAVLRAGDITMMFVLWNNISTKVVCCKIKIQK